MIGGLLYQSLCNRCRSNRVSQYHMMTLHVGGAAQSSGSDLVRAGQEAEGSSLTLTTMGSLRLPHNPVSQIALGR